MEPLASSDKKGFAEWLASAKELKDNIKNLYSKAKGIAGKVEGVYVKALNIGRLTLRLMKLPSDIAVSLAEKIKGYSTLTANLINQYKNDPLGIEKIKAAYATATLALTGAIAAIASGSALTVAEIAIMTGATTAGVSGGAGGAGGVETKNTNASMGAMSREQAVKTSEQIAALLESVDTFKDEKIVAIKINGEDVRATAQTVDSAIIFTGEVIAELEDAADSGVPLAVIQYANDLINSKNNTIGQLKESLRKPAGRSAKILEDAIVFEEKKKAQIQAVGGGNVDQILQIIDNSLGLENESKKELISITDNATGDFVDASPTSHLVLHELVYASVLLITNASFALPMQKIITLDRDRQAVELCAELYGTTDYLDEFIMQNKFNIDEIELLPMGKKVSYYVKNA
jgi:stage V sporulation protein SpoVS